MRDTALSYGDARRPKSRGEHKTCRGIEATIMAMTEPVEVDRVFRALTTRLAAGAAAATGNEGRLYEPADAAGKLRGGGAGAF